MLKAPLRNPVKGTILCFSFLFTTNIILSQPNVIYEPLIPASEGLNSPIELATAPGDVSGRLFIAVKGGSIWIWDGNSILPTPS